MTCKEDQTELMISAAVIARSGAAEGNERKLVKRHIS